MIAAFNAASWCNLGHSYRDVEKAAKSCGYHPEKGIYHFQFSNLISKLNIPAKKMRPRSLGELESKMYLGKFFIFLYTPTGEFNGHAIVAFTDHEGNIRLINPDSERETWDEFAAEIYAKGMKNMSVWELPCRELV